MAWTTNIWGEVDVPLFKTNAGTRFKKGVTALRFGIAVAFMMNNKEL